MKTKDNLEFVSSGSILLNLALSGRTDGGWKIGRIINIIGDKSTGKTLLAIEAITYALKVLAKSGMKVKVVYDETESAFDLPYAETLGMPIDLVEFTQSPTVEEWYKSMDKLFEEDNDLLLYVLDSLDAVSSKQDSERNIDDGTYGTSKAKMMGELFRRLASKIEKSRMLLMIISQERDKIGVAFGKKTTRSGGRALDFYASQIVWLSEKGKVKVKERAVGLNIKAKVDKNKVWRPYREAEFPILFEYGIDDVGSMADFLIDNVLEKSGTWFVWKGAKYHREDLIAEMEKDVIGTRKMVSEAWNELEEKSKVTRKPKYKEGEVIG